jgi:uncharacterized protein (TIGR02466 family)
MDEVANLSRNTLLVKDISSLIDCENISKAVNDLEYNPNVHNTISIDKHIFKQEVFAELGNVIKEQCVDYLRNFWIPDNGMTFEDLKITESWANISTQNESHHLHDHPFSVVSGVMFLDDTVDNLNLSFEVQDIEIPYWRGKSKSYPSLRNLVGDSCTLQNHIVLFLSTTGHFVREVQTETPRRTIAFNTFWKGRVGDFNNKRFLEYAEF